MVRAAAAVVAAAALTEYGPIRTALEVLTHLLLLLVPILPARLVSEEILRQYRSAVGGRLVTGQLLVEIALSVVSNMHLRHTKTNAMPPTPAPLLARGCLSQSSQQRPAVTLADGASDLFEAF